MVQKMLPAQLIQILLCNNRKLAINSLPAFFCFIVICLQMPKLIRITTVPLSLNVLLRGQMRYMNEHGIDVTMVAGEGKDWKEVIANEGCRHQLIPMTRKMTPFADIK